MREGLLRDGTIPASNVADDNPGMAWSIDDRVAFGAAVATSLDESQVAVTEAYFKMMR